MTDVNKVGSSFKITADDGHVAGRTDFRDHDDERVFFHTEIDDAYGGQGLAGTLVRAALTETAAEDRSIVAICPFVRGWLEKHPGEFTWRRPTPEDIDWIKDQLS